VDLHPANIAHAPARSIDDDTGLSIERHVGELVAGGASLVAEALREYHNGGLTPATKRQGGDCIAHLYRLRQFMIADWPFDAICREHGTTVLHEQCGNDINAATIEELVGAVMSILTTVVRKAVN
jgi:hypothetical protein